MATPLLSLVTGTLNRPESFRRLVRSIQERTLVDWELVVSDASDQPYPDRWPENVIIIPERPRLGCVKGYNRAFARARGKWVIWLNDDAEVMPGYASNAVDFMEKHPEVGIGALYYVENILPYRIWTYQDLPYANFGIIKKEFGDQIGWFDEDIITMYGNDNSICFKSFLAGKPVIGIPSSRIWHHLVNDVHKQENQKYRDPDSTALMQRYRPLLLKMYEVWEKYKHLQKSIVIEE